MPLTRADGWSNDVTVRALAWLNLGEMPGPTRGGETRDAEPVMGSCRRIARETLESAYSWYRDGDGTKELKGIRDNVE